MSKASRRSKEQYGTTLREYRRLRRFMEAEDREASKGMGELRNLHRKFFVENSWIPTEKRNEYKYSPEFWDWCRKRVKAFRRIRNVR